MKAKQRPGVVFQPNVHRALQRGITTLVNAIRPTLGPVACGVAIDPMASTNRLPEFLDEGGVIARRIIELPNRDEDMGAMLVRAMLIRQQERIGDGTATAAVLFEAIFNAGLRYLAAGGNAMQLRRHLEDAVPLIMGELDRMVVRLDGQTALTNVAQTLCHDPELAALLGEAFDMLGEFGRLDIRDDYGRILRHEFVEGTYYHTGLFSPALLPKNTATITLENPAIFLCDFEVTDYHELFPILEAANDANINGLVIITRSLSETATSLLVTHNRLDKFKIIAIELPGLNPEDRMAALEDLSRLTGAEPFISATGTSLEKVTAKHFGGARRLWADTKTFGLIGGRGNPRQLREHLRTLQQNYPHTEAGEPRKKAHERIGNLMGRSITLWVGGFTEPDIKARKSLTERTASIMRTAMEGGVVPGAGIALLNCRQVLARQPVVDTDQRAAYRILSEALDAPARTIFRNAGYDPSEVMARLSLEGPDVGFDVEANRLVNMCEAGILDSALVIKTSLRNAITTAALALTIDSLVHLANPELVARPE